MNYTISRTANTFEGALTIPDRTVTTVSSLADGVSYGNIIMGAASGNTVFDWRSGEIGPLSLNYRKFIMAFGTITNHIPNLLPLGSNLYLQAGTCRLNRPAGNLAINGALFNNGNLLTVTGTPTTNVALAYGTAFGNRGNVNIDSGTPYASGHHRL